MSTERELIRQQKESQISELAALAKYLVWEILPAR
jgi:hypothetical protein